jgi:mRNA interferase MazF
VVNRGEIWWADLPEPLGSEPGYRRPLVIVQADRFNRSRIGTSIGVILTRNTSLAAAPGNILLTSRQTGLPSDSVVNVSQVVTVDRRILLERVGTLSSRLMHLVDEGLRLALDL